MRVTLKKRLAKLEQVVPSKAKAEAHEAEWREAFKEFGLPPDTPIPNYPPIIIRAAVQPDEATPDKLLSLSGQFVKGRRPFNTQELKGILAAAQVAWSKRGRDRDLLMMLRVLLYTGARPMEIAQLRPCDVQGGVISINDHDGKQIKNEASIRDIPIHPEIADFEKFAKSGGKLVFKSFDTIQDRKAEALSTRFTRLIRRQMNITDQRKTLYSLRHNGSVQNLSHILSGDGSVG